MQDAASRPVYLDGVFGKQSRLCVVLLQPIKLLNSISIFDTMHRGQPEMCKGNREGATVNRSQKPPGCGTHWVKLSMPPW